MKESIGSTVLLEIFLILFVIYTAFLAVTINYAKTFQLKNQITTALEKGQTYNEAEEAINTYLKNNNIKKSCALVTELSDDYRNNICEIQRVDTKDGYYYTLEVFVVFDVPILPTNIYFPIKGETKNISLVNNNQEKNKADYKINVITE